MANNADEDRTRSLHLIVEAGFRQAKLLENIANSFDQRAGVLIGLLAVAIALAFQADSPNTSAAIDLLFWFSGFVLLFAALAFLAASFAPSRRRYGPDIVKLNEACLDLDEEATQEAIAKELGEVWSHNGRRNQSKAALFKTGLWLSLSGLAILAFDVLVVRPFI